MSNLPLLQPQLDQSSALLSVKSRTCVQLPAAGETRYTTTTTSPSSKPTIEIIIVDVHPRAAASTL